jgi:hypothetical protein
MVYALQGKKRGWYYRQANFEEEYDGSGTISLFNISPSEGRNAS